MGMTLFCRFCGVAVKELPEGVRHIGRGKVPKYVHVTKRSDKDPVQCPRANLYEDEVTKEDWWYGRTESS